MLNIHITAENKCPILFVPSTTPRLNFNKSCRLSISSLAIVQIDLRDARPQQMQAQAFLRHHDTVELPAVTFTNWYSMTVITCVSDYNILQAFLTKMLFQWLFICYCCII